jgi:hypothetical protein
LRQYAQVWSAVIPGRAKGVSPESIITILEELALETVLGQQGLWIPDSPLRGDPE